MSNANEPGPRVAARMRILHTEASLGWGGQEIRILDEAEGILGRGHSVALAAPREAPIFEAALKRGLDALSLPIARKSPRGFFALRRWLQAHPVDVINTHSSTDSWLAALACATLAGAPAIVRTRHISASVPTNLPTCWLYRTATRHVVTTSESLRLQLIRDNGLAPERTTSIPTGIDAARFIPGSRDAAPHRPPARSPAGRHRRHAAELEGPSLPDRSFEPAARRCRIGRRRRRAAATQHRVQNPRARRRRPGLACRKSGPRAVLVAVAGRVRAAVLCQRRRAAGAGAGDVVRPALRYDGLRRYRRDRPRWDDGHPGQDRRRGRPHARPGKGARRHGTPQAARDRGARILCRESKRGDDARSNGKGVSRCRIVSRFALAPAGLPVTPTQLT